MRAFSGRHVARWSWRVLLLLALLVAGCKNNAPLPPIESLGQPPGIRLNHHTVSRGDTLYSIAWRYGMDYHQLASLNSIRPPYTIYVGQKLDLGQSSPHTVSSSETVVSPGVSVAAVADESSGVVEVGGVAEVQPVESARPEPVVASREAPAVTVQPEPAVVEPVAAPKPAAATGKWLWPSSGRLVSSFSPTDPLRKGIDLAGQQGDPVLASRAGSVVYAGNGLAGYGELVIVKHDEQFLSAYGHNSVLLVKEGESVRAGQKIAEVGSSGTDANKLHFEIRRDGKPVDPLQYLPRK